MSCLKKLWLRLVDGLFISTKDETNITIVNRSLANLLETNNHYLRSNVHSFALMWQLASIHSCKVAYDEIHDNFKDEIVGDYQLLLKQEQALTTKLKIVQVREAQEKDLGVATDQKIVNSQRFK